MQLRPAAGCCDSSLFVKCAGFLLNHLSVIKFDVKQECVAYSSCLQRLGDGLCGTRGSPVKTQTPWRSRFYGICRFNFQPKKNNEQVTQTGTAEWAEHWAVFMLSLQKTTIPSDSCAQTTSPTAPVVQCRNVIGEQLILLISVQVSKLNGTNCIQVFCFFVCWLNQPPLVVMVTVSFGISCAVLLHEVWLK